MPKAFARNALGSNIVSTDDNQNVLVRYEYEVFGAIRNQTGTSDNTRKLTGKEFDTDCYLYYYAARYYDPYIGRFTQRDPIDDGVNWYAYTRNNPLKFIDPTGLGLWDIVEFAGGPVVGLVVDGGKAIVDTVADVGEAVFKAASSGSYMGIVGGFFGAVAVLNYGISETAQFLGADIEEPSLRFDDRGMLISQGGYVGEWINTTDYAAVTLGPIVFASETKVNKKTPARRNQLWDHEAVHVQQQWRNGWTHPGLYIEQWIRNGYDDNIYEQEARYKSGESLRGSRREQRNFYNRYINPNRAKSRRIRGWNEK